MIRSSLPAHALSISKRRIRLVCAAKQQTIFWNSYYIIVFECFLCEADYCIVTCVCLCQEHGWIQMWAHAGQIRAQEPVGMARQRQYRERLTDPRPRRIIPCEGIVFVDSGTGQIHAPCFLLRVFSSSEKSIFWMWYCVILCSFYLIVSFMAEDSHLCTMGMSTR